MSHLDYVVTSSHSYVDGMKFEFPVTRRELEACPRWERNTSDPPLAVRDALHLAEEFLPRLVLEAERWTVSSITLCPWSDDHWLYSVHFRGFHPPDVHDGPVPHIELTVLMDGTVVEPIISEHRLL